MNDLFLRACRGEPTPRPPIWIMRQAGRYLPEYRKVRAEVDFSTLCQTPELAAKVTLQPVERFDLDAAILFADIMTPLTSMGVSLAFDPGPVVAEPVRCDDDVNALRVPEREEIAPFVSETVRLVARQLGGRLPLIGFAGAPLTLAAYLVEGGGAKDFSRLRSFLAQAPKAAERLLGKLADVMGMYLRNQIECGAQTIQLFDSWAGILSEDMYLRFALPAVQRVMRSIADLGVPRIYFAQDVAAFLPRVVASGAEVIGIDWRTDLRQARALLGDDVVLQGNLDPAILRASPEIVAREARRVLRDGGGVRHVFNLGHGILPDTGLDSVYRLVEVVHAHQPSV